MSTGAIDPLTVATVSQNPFTIFPGAGGSIEHSDWRRNRVGTSSQVTINTSTNEVTITQNGRGITYEQINSGSGLCDLSGSTGFKVTGYTDGDLNLEIKDDSGGSDNSNGTPSGSDTVWTFSSDFPGVNTSEITEFTFKASASGGVTFGIGGGEPHLVCLDNARLDVYDEGAYRLFEDPATGLAVNIAVKNTYISELVATTRERGVVAHVRFDVDGDRSLHANFVEVVSATSAGVVHSDDRKDLEIEVCGFSVDVQSKYRAVGVRNAAWKHGDVVTVGGTLAGTIVPVPSMEENKMLPKFHTGVELGKWDANALSCDAHFPHLVTFFGDQIIPGPGEHTLFSHGGVTVRATTDDFSRLSELWVVSQERETVRGVWTRNDAPPDQDAAPKVSLTVNGTDVEPRSGVHESTLALLSGAASDETATELFLRLQANGAASFALRNVEMASLTEAENGLLARRSEAHAAVTKESALGTAASYISIYEQGVEPHLAWKRGAEAGGMSATAKLGQFILF